LYIIEDIETSFWSKKLNCYGYSLESETSLVDTFTDMVKQEVNSEFSTGYDSTDILSITFSRNVIVIKKRKSTEHRKYKFYQKLEIAHKPRRMTSDVDGNDED
jgi:hypothetical protein